MAVLIAVVIVPILGARNIFYLEVIFQIAVFAALALGLNIVVGFSGLLNFGYMAFYAVGAYLWGFFGSQQPFLLHEIPGTAPPGTHFFLAPDWFYLFIFLGIIVAAIVGLVMGLPVLRVRGDYLAVITLGCGEIIRQLANNLDKPLNLTNGPQGITPIQRPSLPKELLAFFNRLFEPLVGHQVTENQFYNIMFYLIALLVVVAVIVVTFRLEDSKIGRAWAAIREDELAAQAMGIPANKLKLGAFAVGASFAGAMGVLFAASRTFVSPESFTFLQSVGVLTMVILGGIGSHLRRHHRRGGRHGPQPPGPAELLALPRPAQAERRGDPHHQLPLEGPLQPDRPLEVPAPGLRHHPHPHDDLQARRASSRPPGASASSRSDRRGGRGRLAAGAPMAKGASRG